MPDYIPQDLLDSIRASRPATQTPSAKPLTLSEQIDLEWEAEERARREAQAKKSPPTPPASPPSSLLDYTPWEEARTAATRGAIGAAGLLPRVHQLGAAIEGGVAGAFADFADQAGYAGAAQTLRDFRQGVGEGSAVAQKVSQGLTEESAKEAQRFSQAVKGSNLSVSPWGYDVNLREFAGGAAGSIAEQLPAIAARLNPMGQIAYGASLAASRSYDQARSEGLTHEDALAYAATQGALEAAPAAAMQRLGLGGLEAATSRGALSQAQREALRSGKKGVAKYLGKQAGAEALEEVITEGLQQPVSASYLPSERGQYFDPQQLINAAGAGALAGGGISGAGLIGGKARLAAEREHIAKLKERSAMEEELRKRSFESPDAGGERARVHREMREAAKARGIAEDQIQRVLAAFDANRLAQMRDAGASMEDVYRDFTFDPARKDSAAKPFAPPSPAETEALFRKLDQESAFNEAFQRASPESLASPPPQPPPSGRTRALATGKPSPILTTENTAPPPPPFSPSPLRGDLSRRGIAPETGREEDRLYAPPRRPTDAEIDEALAWTSSPAGAPTESVLNTFRFLMGEDFPAAASFREAEQALQGAFPQEALRERYPGAAPYARPAAYNLPASYARVTPYPSAASYERPQFGDARESLKGHRSASDPISQASEQTLDDTLRWMSDPQGAPPPHVAELLQSMESADSPQSSLSRAERRRQERAQFSPPPPAQGLPGTPLSQLSPQAKPPAGRQRPARVVQPPPPASPSYPAPSQRPRSLEGGRQERTLLAGLQRKKQERAAALADQTPIASPQFPSPQVAYQAPQAAPQPQQKPQRQLPRPAQAAPQPLSPLSPERRAQLEAAFQAQATAQQKREARRKEAQEIQSEAGKRLAMSQAAKRGEDLPETLRGDEAFIKKTAAEAIKTAAEAGRGFPRWLEWRDEELRESVKAYFPALAASNEARARMLESEAEAQLKEEKRARSGYDELLAAEEARSRTVDPVEREERVKARRQQEEERSAEYAAFEEGEALREQEARLTADAAERRELERENAELLAREQATEREIEDFEESQAPAETPPQEERQKRRSEKPESFVSPKRQREEEQRQQEREARLESEEIARREKLAQKEEAFKQRAQEIEQARQAMLGDVLLKRGTDELWRGGKEVKTETPEQVGDQTTPQEYKDRNAAWKERFDVEDAFEIAEREEITSRSREYFIDAVEGAETAMASAFVAQGREYFEQDPQTTFLSLSPEELSAALDDFVMQGGVSEVQRDFAKDVAPDVPRALLFEDALQERVLKDIARSAKGIVAATNRDAAWVNASAWAGAWSRRQNLQARYRNGEIDLAQFRAQAEALRRETPRIGGQFWPRAQGETPRKLAKEGIAAPSPLTVEQFTDPTFTPTTQDYYLFMQRLLQGEEKGSAVANARRLFREANYDLPAFPKAYARYDTPRQGTRVARELPTQGVPGAFEKLNPVQPLIDSKTGLPIPGTERPRPREDFRLFQVGPDGKPKGSFELLEDGGRLIQLFDGATVDTLMEELVHAFRLDLTNEQQQVLLRHVGKESWEDGEADEKVAASFRAWMASEKGKKSFPKGLAKTFESLARFMKSAFVAVWKGKAQGMLDIEIDDEVASVFGRMMGGEKPTLKPPPAPPPSPTSKGDEEDKTPLETASSATTPPPSSSSKKKGGKKKSSATKKGVSAFVPSGEALVAIQNAPQAALEAIASGAPLPSSPPPSPELAKAARELKKAGVNIRQLPVHMLHVAGEHWNRLQARVAEAVALAKLPEAERSPRDEAVIVKKKGKTPFSAKEAQERVARLWPEIAQWKGNLPQSLIKAGASAFFSDKEMAARYSDKASQDIYGSLPHELGHAIVRKTGGSNGSVDPTQWGDAILAGLGYDAATILADQSIEELRSMDYEVVRGQRKQADGRPHEGFAEFLREYLTTASEPAHHFSTIAPKFYQRFTTDFKEDYPLIWRRIQETREALRQARIWEGDAPLSAFGKGFIADSRIQSEPLFPQFFGDWRSAADRKEWADEFSARLWRKFIFPIRRAGIDANQTLFDLERKARKVGVDVAKEMSAYAIATAMGKTASAKGKQALQDGVFSIKNASKLFTKTTLPEALSTVTQQEVDEGDFQAWAMARHLLDSVKRREAKIAAWENEYTAQKAVAATKGIPAAKQFAWARKETESRLGKKPSPYQVAGNKSKAELQAILDDATDDQKKRWEEGANKLTKIYNALLDMQVEARVITPGERDRMVAAHPTYLKIERVKTTGMEGKLAKFSGGFINLNSGKKRRKSGSDLPIVDPIVTLYAEATRAYEIAARQLANDALANLYLQVRNTKGAMEGGLNRYFSLLGVQESPMTDAERKAAIARARAEGVSDNLFDDDANFDDLLPMTSPLKVKRGGEEKVIHRVLTTDGKQIFVELSPSLYATVSNLDTQTVERFQKLWKKYLTAPIKVGATGLNLFFNVAQIPKDFFTFPMRSKSALRFQRFRDPVTGAPLESYFQLAAENLKNWTQRPAQSLARHFTARFKDYFPDAGEKILGNKAFQYVLGIEDSNDALVRLYRHWGGDLGNIAQVDGVGLRNHILRSAGTKVPKTPRTWKDTINPLKIFKQGAGTAMTGLDMAMSFLAATDSVYRQVEMESYIENAMIQDALAKGRSIEDGRRAFAEVKAGKRDVSFEHALGGFNAGSSVLYNYRRTSPVSDFLDNFIPFFNASTQVISQDWERAAEFARQGPRGMAELGLRMTLFGVLPTLGYLAYISADKEREKAFLEQPWWRKLGYWMGFGEYKDAAGNIRHKNVAQIPMPQGAGSFAVGATIAAWHVARERDPEGVKEFLKDFAMDQVPALNLAPLGALRAAIEGKDAFGRPLFEGNEDIPIEMQFDDDTWSFFRSLGKHTAKIGVSPAKLQGIASELTGGLAERAAYMQDYFGADLPLIEESPVAQQTAAARIPFFSKFLFSKNYSQTNTEFFDQRKKANEGIEGWRKQITEDMKAAGKSVEEIAEATALDKAPEKLRRDKSWWGWHHDLRNEIRKIGEATLDTRLRHELADIWHVGVGKAAQGEHGNTQFPNPAATPLSQLPEPIRLPVAKALARKIETAAMQERPEITLGEKREEREQKIKRRKFDIELSLDILAPTFDNLSDEQIREFLDIAREGRPRSEAELFLRQGGLRRARRRYEERKK